jgi:hypothetical protein
MAEDFKIFENPDEPKKPKRSAYIISKRVFDAQLNRFVSTSEHTVGKNKYDQDYPYPEASNISVSTGATSSDSNEYGLCHTGPFTFYGENFVGMFDSYSCKKADCEGVFLPCSDPNQGTDLKYQPTGVQEERATRKMDLYVIGSDTVYIDVQLIDNKTCEYKQSFQLFEQYQVDPKVSANKPIRIVGGSGLKNVSYNESEGYQAWVPNEETGIPEQIPWVDVSGKLIEDRVNSQAASVFRNNPDIDIYTIDPTAYPPEKINIGYVEFTEPVFDYMDSESHPATANCEVPFLQPVNKNSMERDGSRGSICSFEQAMIYNQCSKNYVVIEDLTIPDGDTPRSGGPAIDDLTITATFFGELHDKNGNAYGFATVSEGIGEADGTPVDGIFGLNWAWDDEQEKWVRGDLSMPIINDPKKPWEGQGGYFMGLGAYAALKKTWAEGFLKNGTTKVQLSPGVFAGASRTQTFERNAKKIINGGGIDATFRSPAQLRERLRDANNSLESFCGCDCDKLQAIKELN